MKTISLSSVFGLGLVAVGMSISSHSWAKDVCSQVVLNTAMSQARNDYGEKQWALPLGEGRSPFDIRGRVQDHINNLGLGGVKSAYACRTQSGSQLCLAPLNDDTWAVRGAWHANFRATTSGDQIKLEYSSYHSAGGDPWYGIGSESWSNDYLLRFDTKSNAISLLYKDGANTNFGFKKRSKDTGTCSVADVQALAVDLDPALREMVLKGMLGTPGVAIGPVTSNLFMLPGKLYLATSVSLKKSQVELLDLENGSRKDVLVDDLAAYRAWNTQEIAGALSRAGQVSKEFLTGGSKRSWSCLSSPNDLLNSQGRAIDIQHHGFTRIEMSSISRAPGADLGYRPLSEGKITRAGFTGSIRRAVFPNGESSVTLVTDAQGRSLIINDVKTSSFAPIVGLPKAAALKAIGMEADLITFGQWICLGN